MLKVLFLILQKVNYIIIVNYTHPFTLKILYFENLSTLEKYYKKTVLYSYYPLVFH